LAATCINGDDTPLKIGGRGVLSMTDIFLSTTEINRYINLNSYCRRISKPELQAFLHFLGTTFWDALAEVAVCGSSTFPGSKNSSCKNFHIDLINLAPTTPYFKRLVYSIWLVVSTHLKNISQIGSSPQLGAKKTPETTI